MTVSYLSVVVWMDFAGESPPLLFRGDFIAGKLRYSNSEFTEIVEETLTPGRRERGEIRVTFNGIFSGVQVTSTHKRERACFIA